MVAWIWAKLSDIICEYSHNTSAIFVETFIVNTQLNIEYWRNELVKQIILYHRQNSFSAWRDAAQL